MKAPSRTRRGWAYVKQFWPGLSLLLLFAITVLTGGGARSSIDSLLILRPIAAFAFFIGLALLTRSRIERFRPLLWLCLAILATIAIQLVPLPADLWANLPGRMPYAKAATEIGVDGLARPISLYPAYSWNAFFAALVPFSLLLFFIAAKPRFRHLWLHGLLLFGLLSALFGLLQMGGPKDGLLYFYRITNNGSAVGMFASRNHLGMLLAFIPPLIVHAIVRLPMKYGRIFTGLGVLCWLFMALMVVAVGSRMGLLTFVISSLLTALMLPAGLRAKFPMPERVKRMSQVLIPMIGIFALALVFFLATNNAATERLFSSTLKEEARVLITPATIQMIGEFFPSGAGGGTFPRVFLAFESGESLLSTMMNHAHNDYLEVAFEYGLPGMLLILAGLVMFAVYGVRAWFAKVPLAELIAARAAVVGLVILLVGSISDYPMRTPTLAVVGILLAATLLRHRDPLEERLSE